MAGRWLMNTAPRAVTRGASPPSATGWGLLHLKLFHPLDDRVGFAPLASAGAALDLHNAASHWNKRLLDNSARPSGALVYQPRRAAICPPSNMSG